MPLYVAVIQFLRKQGCAGATATRAVASYGAGSRLHESGGLRWSSDASIIIQVVDQPERLRRLLPSITEALHRCQGTVDEVCNGSPLELDSLLQGRGCRFRCLDHEMLLVEMLERGRISSPDARGEIEPRGEPGMQTHLLAPGHT